ncbi:hypothetical protein [Paenibacillus sp. PL2-23]|uniref:hypothetical protein n=1 Tax=Paenibacillus sp. PL2-23 TaxID=2100729 RepID=UPI0030F84D8F
MAATGNAERKEQVIRHIASRALAAPLLPSGLWYHGDIRDNFYDASYLFAAAQSKLLSGQEAERASELAASVLEKVLSLQDMDPTSATYGHFPLKLGEELHLAKPHPLPVELMGPLMALFLQQFGEHMPSSLRNSFDNAVWHMYKSQYYVTPLERFGHHVAKHTAGALIYAVIYNDDSLLRASHERIRATLSQVRTYGMTEYGSLPWFWHWVQAFAAAWELATDEAVRKDLSELLEWLWEERASYYLHGAWVGPHCRSWPHDAPADRNLAMDYVQFGDIPMPDQWPRVEYAGLLAYDISDAVRSRVFNRTYPIEHKRTYPLSAEQPQSRLHSYTYMTEQFALGGMKERRLEFDNEQRRWDFSFPIREDSVNQAYFYSPAGAHDARHSGDCEEIAIHRGCVIAIYRPHPQGSDIAGILPLPDSGTEWTLEGTSLYGKVNDTYIAIHALHHLRIERGTDRYDVRSEGSEGNVIVMEAVTVAEASLHHIDSLGAFIASSRNRQPLFSDAKLGGRYSLFNGDMLELQLEDDNTPAAKVNGEPMWQF